MNELPPLPATPLGPYRHYKGGEYEVLAVARPLYNDSGWWVRPHAMFFGQVEIDGRVQPRFAPVAAA
jgi:hypothetical protein